MSSSTSLSTNATVLVTGSGGYIGSAITWQLLKQGFRVRGTTRTASKLHLLKEKADKEFGAGKFEIVEIANLSVKGALDDALKGVEGVINVASEMSFSPDLEKVVSSVVSLNEEVLYSAKAAGTVKSFVSTSSRLAAFHSDNVSTYNIDQDSWYDEPYGLAEKCQDTFKGVYVYIASKVAGEKAVWNFVEKEKPEFRVNTIGPDLVIGSIKNPAPGAYSTASSLLTFADDKPGFLDIAFRTPAWYVDVEDTAKLHVAALLDESVNKQRLWAAAGPFSAATIQEAVRAVKPNLKGVDVSQFPSLPLNIIYKNQASIDLLQKHYHHGFKSLEETVKANLAGS